LLELWLKRFPLEALKTKSRAPLNSCDLPVDYNFLGKFIKNIFPAKGNGVGLN
jgi:hypothetical protein